MTAIKGESNEKLNLTVAGHGSIDTEPHTIEELKEKGHKIIDKKQGFIVKNVFKSGRWDSQTQAAGSWVPPIDLAIDSKHGTHLFVNGRRKWKSAGGYPTLTHGGLSVLEVAVPFIEITKV